MNLITATLMDPMGTTTTKIDPHFWIKKELPEIFLAPMEGVTDAPLRAYFAHSSTITRLVTEFIRVSNSVLPAKVFRRKMPEVNTGSTLNGRPVHLQLLGGHPERVALSALEAVKAGAGAIDLNFGCPAPTVNRNDGGAALLKDPRRLGEIVKAVRAALPAEIPVSAKLRLGFYANDEIGHTAEAAVSGGASWLTIHARTRLQGYSPPVDWEKIGEVMRRYPIPIVANGDIWTFEDFLRCREITGAEHFMLGRGALANPLLIEQVANELGCRPTGARTLWGTTWYQRLSEFRQIADRCKGQENWNDHYLLARMKRWTKFAQVRGEIDWFDSVKQIETLDGFLDSIARLEKPLERFSFIPSVLVTESCTSALHAV